ncbi:PLAT domain-containing protein 2 [Bienertia sinuspersici]
MAAKHFLSTLTIFLCISLFSFYTTADEEFSCVYTIYVRTSTTFIGGTDSKISATFYDDTGSGVLIKDLETWGGLMGRDWDYYERGNLDIFSGRGPCLNGPVCYLNLTSDGSGAGWYCNYVEVTTTGPHTKCAQQLFTVEQWLSTHRSPYELSTSRDLCNNTDFQGLKRRRSSDSLLPVETLLASSS